MQVCELDMLESLILHNNGLPSLRREIGMLTNLVNLSLTGNYLAELPPTVHFMSTIVPIRARLPLVFVGSAPSAGFIHNIVFAGIKYDSPTRAHHYGQ